MAALAELLDLTTLSRAECLALLSTGSIGRVVCTDGALPTAEPVNYALVAEEIIFRTHTRSRLAEAARNAVVAFQADRIDGASGLGWSVQGVGKTYEITGDRRSDLVGSQHRLWTAEHPSHLIAIPLWRLTGRRLTLSARAAGADPLNPVR